MKRTAFRAAAVFAILVVFLFTAGCGIIFDAIGEILDEPSKTESQNGAGNQSGNKLKFSKIAYERPDLDGMTGDFEALISDLEGDKLPLKEAVNRLEKVYAAYDDFYTMDVVAELRWYHDVTDSFYADECDWFLENEPTVDQLFEELCSASANCSLARELDEEFWGGWVVDSYGGEEESATLDPEYLALAQRENTILAEYRKATSDPTVTWKGKERSYWELEQDDTIGWDEWTEIRSLYYDKYEPILGDIYIRLVGVRQEQAKLFGFDSYEEYAYACLFGRDYSPEQADVLLEQIRTELAPLYEELDLNRRWDDFSYTELNEEENLEAVRTAARAMGGKVRQAFMKMEDCELCDVEISEKKGDLSYQTYLYSYDCPYVFVKTEGYSDDILSFGHEFGHFVDAWCNFNGTDSQDLAEVFSQGMEYLLLSYVPEDYREELTEYKLLDTVDTFTQQGSFAEFEHEVYSRPAAEWTPEALNELSLKLAQDYGYAREGDEDYYAKSWIDINHFFDDPFYVVSYCVSNDAAFQIYELECEKEGAGLEVWKKMLPRNYDGFLETLTEQGGLEDPFAAGRMKEVAELLKEKLG